MEDLLGKDFRCGADTQCDEHGNTCCFMCEDLEKCEEPCDCITDEDLCKYIENRLNELDNKCNREDCTCKEEKECIDSIDCEPYHGTNKCCLFCDEKEKCDYRNRCAFVEDYLMGGLKLNEFECDYFKRPLDEQE